MDQEKVPLYHNGHPKPCNGIAFYSLGEYAIGELLACKKAILLDGSHPIPGSVMVCGSCGKVIYSTMELSYDLQTPRQ